jgi:START domain/Integral peroxisomal membrane peroxin
MFLDVQHRGEWDELFARGSMIEIIDPWTHVSHIEFKPVSVSSARDMCLVSRTMYQENGEMWTFSASIDHPDCPPQAKIVRGHLLFGCSHIRPIDDKTSEVIYTVAFDPLGRIPGSVVKMLSTKQPLCIAAIRDLVTKSYRVRERALRHAKERMEQYRQLEEQLSKQDEEEELILYVSPSDSEQDEDASVAESEDDNSGSGVLVEAESAVAFEPDVSTETVTSEPAPEAVGKDAVPEPVPEPALAPASAPASATVLAEQNDDKENIETVTSPVASPDPEQAAIAKRKARLAESKNPVLPPHYARKLGYALVRAARAAQETEADGWKSYGTKEDVEIWTKKDGDSDINWCKGRGLINAPAILPLEVYSNLRFMNKWDVTFDHGEEVARYTLDIDALAEICPPFADIPVKLDDNAPLPETGLNYVAYKAPWPVKPRDILILGVALPLKDGTVLVCSTSVEHEDAPELSKYVRGEIVFSGLQFRAPTPKTCEITYVVGFDPRGSIPTFLVNAASVQTPLTIDKVRQIVTRDKDQIEVIWQEIHRRVDTGGQMADHKAIEQTDAKHEDIASDANIDIDTKSITEDDYKVPPSKYDDMLAGAYERALEAVNSGEEAGWKFHARMDEVDIFLRSIPGTAINCTKGVGTIHAPVDVVQDVFTNFDIKHLWDEMFDFGRVLEIVNLRIRISYSAMKAPWPVTPRDVVVIGRSVTLPDGARMIYSCSCEHPDAPVVKKYVRSILSYGVIHLVPVSANETKVTYSIGADPKGSLPAMIVNAVNTKQPLTVAKIRKLIETRPDLAKEAAANAKYKSEQRRLAAIKQLKDGGATAGSGPAAATATDEADEKADVLAPDQKAALRKAKKLALEAIEQDERHGWKSSGAQKQIAIFTKPRDGSTTFCKGIGTVHASAVVVYNVFADQSNRAEWDEMFSHGRTLQQVDEHTNIYHHAMKAPWPVKARDMVLLNRTIVLADGTIFSYTTSVKHPSCPEDSSYVRADLIFSALHIRPLNPNSCRVTYSVGVDVKGSLPQWVTDMTNVKQPLCIAAVRDLIARRPDMVSRVKSSIAAAQYAGVPAAAAAEASAAASEDQYADARVGSQPIEWDNKQTTQPVFEVIRSKNRTRSLIEGARYFTAATAHALCSRSGPLSLPPLQVGALSVRIVAVMHADDAVKSSRLRKPSLACRVGVGYNVEVGRVVSTTKPDGVDMPVTEWVGYQPGARALSFGERFAFPIYNPNEFLFIQFMAEENKQDMILAQARVPLSDICDGQARRSWFKLQEPASFHHDRADVTMLCIDTHHAHSGVADIVSEFLPQSIVPRAAVAPATPGQSPAAGKRSKSRRPDTTDTDVTDRVRNHRDVDNKRPPQSPIELLERVVPLPEEYHRGPLNVDVMVSEWKRLCDTLRPATRVTSRLRAALTWREPSLSALLLFMFVLVVLYPWTLPLLVSLTLMWNIVVEYADHAFENIVSQTTVAGIQARKARQDRVDLVTIVRNEVNRVDPEPTLLTNKVAASARRVFRTSNATSQAQREEIIAARRRTLRKMQGYIQWFADTVEDISNAFNWTDSALTFTIFLAIVVVIVLSLILTPTTQLIICGTTASCWYSPLARSARWVMWRCMRFIRRRTRTGKITRTLT